MNIKLGYISIFKHVKNTHGIKFDAYEDMYENETLKKKRSKTSLVKDRNLPFFSIIK